MKLRKSALALAILAVIFGTLSPAMAQRQGGGGGGGQGQGGGGQHQGPRRQAGGPMFVIRMSTVQQHLQLTAQQVQAINALRPPQGGPGGGPGGPGGDEGGPLAEILNQAQMNRLKQLALQFDAPMTMLDRRQGRALNLTEQQRQAIDQAIRDNMPRPEPGQQPPSFAAMQQAKANARAAAWTVLNDTQKAAWNNLVGAAFTNWVEVPRPPRG